MKILERFRLSSFYCLDEIDDEGMPQLADGAKIIGFSGHLRGFTIKMFTYFMLISASLITENSIC